MDCKMPEEYISGLKDCKINPGRPGFDCIDSKDDDKKKEDDKAAADDKKAAEPAKPAAAPKKAAAPAKDAAKKSLA